MRIRKFLHPIRRIHWKIAFRRAVRKIHCLCEGEIPDRNTLEELQYGWGNPGWVASVDYLEEMCRLAVSAKGPILECGSGLTTLLLGLLNRPETSEIWSLEHKPEWYQLINDQLSKHRVKNVSLHLVSLRDYGNFTWYDVSAQSIPDDIRLVICDGPPGSTPGGRYGLFPVVGSNMARGCTVILDDVNREKEQFALNKWEAETSIRVTIRGTNPPYALVNIL